MGGYILLRVQSGFNDAIFLLDAMTKYALKYKRTIVLTLEIYSATKLDSIFDFSNYPVPIICGEDIVKSLQYSAIEPSCFGMDPYTRSTSRNEYHMKLINGMLTQFDLSREYPDNTLLIFDSVGSRQAKFEVFKGLSLTREFLDKFNKQRDLLPRIFNSIHVRGTDDPTKDKEKTMKEVDNFVNCNPIIPIYIASDDMPLLEEISNTYNIIVKPLSYKPISNYYSLHHGFGRTDPECLSNAIVDLLICASSKIFLRSTGGFSSLIEALHKNSNIVEKLIK